MPGSKYDRELRFIATETKRLRFLIDQLRDVMPSDPAEANAKAEEIMAMEEKMAQLLARKKEIEDSFIAVGMQVPNMSNDLNSNVQDCRSFNDASDAPVVRPSASKEELTAQIESITDELMQIEVKMLRADMNGDDDEKQKLQMMASSLRSRRDTLVEEVKAINTAPPEEEEAPETSNDELEKRLKALESDNRAIRAQVSDIRNDLADIKELLRQLGADRFRD